MHNLRWRYRYAVIDNTKGTRAGCILIRTVTSIGNKNITKTPKKKLTHAFKENMQNMKLEAEKVKTH